MPRVSNFVLFPFVCILFSDHLKYRYNILFIESKLVVEPFLYSNCPPFCRGVSTVLSEYQQKSSSVCGTRWRNCNRNGPEVQLFRKLPYSRRVHRYLCEPGSVEWTVPLLCSWRKWLVNKHEWLYIMSCDDKKWQQGIAIELYTQLECRKIAALVH